MLSSNPVVVEIGSHSIAAGFGIDDLFPSVVSSSVAAVHPSSGSFTYGLPHLLTSHFPLDVDTCALWTTDLLSSQPQAHLSHILSVAASLQAEMASTPLLLVMPEMWYSNTAAIQQLTELLFESTQLPALQFLRPSVCSVLGQGKASAIVVNCGHSGSTVTAVCDGCALHRSVRFSSVGGAYVTSCLVSSLGERSLQFENTLTHILSKGRSSSPAIRSFALRQLMEEMKHMCTSVKVFGPDQMQPAEAKTFVAPDGTRIELQEEEQTACFEGLFSAPKTADNNSFLPEIVLECNKSIDVDLRALLPIVCSGRTALAPNFARRLHDEIKRHDSNFHRLPGLIEATPHGTWQGAAQVTTTGAFGNMWITRGEFEEHGAAGALKRKNVD